MKLNNLFDDGCRNIELNIYGSLFERNWTDINNGWFSYINAFIPIVPSEFSSKLACSSLGNNGPSLLVDKQSIQLIKLESLTSVFVKDNYVINS